jgi:hypothetical protein
VRPTVSEQLEGTARILREVVAPAVEGAYPADVLAGLIATLDALARGWPDVPAFLAWDAARALELLDGVAPELGDDHRAALRRVASETPDALDVRALEAHHERARALLADVVAAGAPPALASTLAGHARDRAGRYPLQAEQRMPGQR